jgi:septal ring-binding cell division protein DamX
VGVSARVAQGGKLRYVLLLGIYETREPADEATKGLPPPLDELDVWMRSMASLQRAIIRLMNWPGHRRTDE